MFRGIFWNWSALEESWRMSSTSAPDFIYKKNWSLFNFSGTSDAWGSDKLHYARINWCFLDPNNQKMWLPLIVLSFQHRWDPTPNRWAPTPTDTMPLVFFQWGEREIWREYQGRHVDGIQYRALRSRVYLSR